MIGDGYAGACNQEDNIDHTDIAQMLLAQYGKASVLVTMLFQLRVLLLQATSETKHPQVGDQCCNSMLVPLCNVGINLAE